MHKTFMHRNNVVSISEKISVDYSNDRKHYHWKTDSNKLDVFREIAKASRKLPETRTINASVISSIRSIKRNWKLPIRSYTRTIQVTRKYWDEKKRKKEMALLYRYNSRTYSRIEFSKSLSFSPSDRNFLSFAQEIKSTSEVVNQRVRNLREFFSVSPVKSKQKFIPSLGMTVSYTTVNGVFPPGELEKVRKQIKSQQIWASKKPGTMEKHFGIEIECFGPTQRETLGVMLIDAGMGRYVELKSDGSIRTNKGDEYAFELAVVAPESKLTHVVTTVCNVLAQAKCKVNKSCGLHVHLDTRTANPDRMFSNLVSAQNILFAMQPLSRRNNKYCEKTPGKDLRAESRKGKRYLGINPMSYNRHRTIEVRLHSGTIEARKILNFVAILNAVAYKNEYTKRGAHTIKGFVKQNNLSVELERYITERVNKFNTDKEIEEAS